VPFMISLSWAVSYQLSAVGRWLIADLWKLGLQIGIGIDEFVAENLHGLEQVHLSPV
jgi:hypothetical protein